MYQSKGGSSMYSLLLAELCVTSRIGGLDWQATLVDAADDGRLSTANIVFLVVTDMHTFVLCCVVYRKQRSRMQQMMGT